MLQLDTIRYMGNKSKKINFGDMHKINGLLAGVCTVTNNHMILVERMCFLWYSVVCEVRKYLAYEMPI